MAKLRKPESLQSLAAVCTFAAFLGCAVTSRGRFAIQETEKVPIDRLLRNLQREQAQNTNDLNITYHLARLHSMAYATNLDKAPVQKGTDDPVFYQPWEDSGVPHSVVKWSSASAREEAFGHLSNAIQLYERSIVLLKRSTNTNEARWLILPTHLGLAWCLDQAGRRQDATQAYRNVLKIAWKQEVTGDFDMNEWLKGALDDAQAGRNPLHSRQRGYLGPGVCYSEETIGYLLKLLDPVKDASDIARLKQDQQTLQGMGRAVTPILIPVGSGSELPDLIDPQAEVSFDLDGSGYERKWGWITPRASWLVYDPGCQGLIKSGLQMFGNVTFWIFWRNGYDALSALDDDGDGIISGSELHGLSLWNDRNCKGLSDPGEVVPVEELGISSISCSSEDHSSGIKWNPCGVTFADGTTRPTFDWVVPMKYPVTYSIGPQP